MVSSPVLGAMSRLQNSGPQQNRPFESFCAPASSPTLSGMVSSAGHGQRPLPSQTASKSSIFLGAGVLQPALMHDLFTPIPETNHSPVKDVFDHAADYVRTASGAWDLFYAVEYVFSYVTLFCPRSQSGASLADRVSTVINTAGIGLSIPQAISDANTFRRTLTHLRTVAQLSPSDPWRTRRVVQAAKDSVLGGITLTNTLLQASLFLDHVKIIAYKASHLKILDGIYYGTYFITDGADLISECYRQAHFNSHERQIRNPRERVQLEQKKCLSWMNIVKNIASVAQCAIVLLAFLFGVVAQGTTVIAVVALVLSTIWFALKIATHFYEKIIIDARSPISSSIAL